MVEEKPFAASTLGPLPGDTPTGFQHTGHTRSLVGRIRMEQCGHSVGSDWKMDFRRRQGL